jgi:chemotaxis-related protein WspD
MNHSGTNPNPAVSATQQNPATDPTPEILNPCWSLVGVYGSISCPDLRHFVHCRNCPVYSSAGVQLLDRPLSPEYRREWTEHFAKLKKIPDRACLSALVFRIESEWLALPTQIFQQVSERRPIHSLPHAGRSFILGLANVRGELLTCISLCQLLGIQTDARQEPLRTSYHRLLVLSCSGSRLAFPVDEVHGPYRFQPEELHPPPSTAPSALPALTQSVLQWQHRTVGLLEPERLISALNRRLK